MHKILFFVYCLISSSYFAQYASIELKEDEAKKLGEISKNATLFLAINNEKDPADAALVNAVKNYWKIGKYKFMSRIEFLTKQAANQLSKTDLYLYESTDAYGTSNPVTVLASVKTGIFCLSLGDRIEKTTRVGTMRLKSTTSIMLKFDVSSTLTDSKDKVNDGFIDLMVKYFNHETEFCQKLTSVKDVKKEEKDGMVYFEGGLLDVQNKDILLVKEQVNKMKISAKNAGKKATPISAVSQFNPPSKNVYTVFPDDVKMAGKKADSKVLIYSNDMLINASNGAVAAAPMNFNEAASKGDPFFWLAAIGILVIALGTSVLLK